MRKNKFTFEKSNKKSLIRQALEMTDKNNNDLVPENLEYPEFIIPGKKIKVDENYIKGLRKIFKLK